MEINAPGLTIHYSPFSPAETKVVIDAEKVKRATEKDSSHKFEYDVNAANGEVRQFALMAPVNVKAMVNWEDYQNTNDRDLMRHFRQELTN